MKISGFAVAAVAGACALLAASEARAAPYVVTIEPEGTDVVATSNAGGEFNLNGLTPAGGFALTPFIRPAIGLLSLSAGATDSYTGVPGTPFGFGSGNVSIDATSSDGPPVQIDHPFLDVPPGYASGESLEVSTNIWSGANFASLGVTPGTFTWTWGTTTPDQSFTIRVVPGPIVGAGLPGLIAVLGGLVAMARRRRKEFA